MQCPVFCALVLVILISDVKSLEPVIHPHNSSDGDFINITCDHQRMVIEPNAKLIQTLTLQRKSVNDASFTKIAIYTPFLPHNTTKSYIPPGRDWNITFSGGDSINGINIETIRINLIISKAECSDAGIYMCTAVTDSGETHKSPEFTETRTAQVTQNPLVLVPLSNRASHPVQRVAGENVTIICVAHGPHDLTLSWRYHNLSSQTDLIYPNPGGNATRTQESSLGNCSQWRHESNISLTLREVDNGVTYTCVVSNHIGEEVKKENLTIAVEIGKSASPADHEAKPDHPVENVTKVHHPVENVTKVHHPTENITKVHHLVENVTQPHHSAGHVTKGDHHNHKSRNLAYRINAPVIHICLMLAVVSLFVSHF